MPGHYQLSSIKREFATREGECIAIDIDRLHIPLGGVIAIVGGSGSGKTTLLNILGGLERPDEVVGGLVPSLQLKLPGEAYVRELFDAVNLRSLVSQYGESPSLRRVDTQGSSDARAFPYRQVSYVFQQGYLLNQASIALNLSMTRRAAGLRADSASLERLLERAHLHDDDEPQTGRKRLKDRAITLSGGQQQRINIARAIGREPAILFADELSSSLDPVKASNVLRSLRHWIWGEEANIIDDRRQLGRTMLWVTHDYALACEFADAVIVLSNGRLAKHCQRPVELAELPERPSPDELQGWVMSASVPVREMRSPSDTEAIDGASVAGVSAVPSREHIGLADGSTVHPRSLRPMEAAIGNMGAGLALSWMESFQPSIASGSCFRQFVSKWLWPVFGYSHWVRALQMGAVLALIIITIYGQQEVVGYFDRELEDPSLRHVIVQQNSRELQRSVIDETSMADLSRSVVGDGESVAFPRFTESVDAYPAGIDFINTGYIAEISLGVLDKQEPVYQQLPVRVIDPDDPDCLGMEARSPSALIPYADELALIVSKSYLQEARSMFDRDLCEHPYLDLWDTGAPRQFRIVGFVDALPADGFDNFDAVIQSGVWRSWNSLVGRSQLSTYSRAAVYFTQSNHGTVMAELEAREFAFDREIVHKFERLIGTAAQLRNTFSAITWLSLAIACTVAAGLIWGYLVQNAKAIAMLRAHDAWLWPLVAAIPFQLILTFVYGLFYLLLCLGAWNLLANVSWLGTYITDWTQGTWQWKRLGMELLGPTIPWLVGSLVTMMIVGWLCLYLWHITHRELAHELRQAY